jgi:hypothetical protein
MSELTRLDGPIEFAGFGQVLSDGKGCVARSEAGKGDAHPSPQVFIPIPIPDTLDRNEKDNTVGGVE